MKICLRLLLALPLALSPAIAQQPSDFDYFQANRTMIRNGAQAILMCNGLFTSNRTLEQVFDQELAILANSDLRLFFLPAVLERRPSCFPE